MNEQERANAKQHRLTLSKYRDEYEQLDKSVSIISSAIGQGEEFEKGYYLGVLEEMILNAKGYNFIPWYMNYQAYKQYYGIEGNVYDKAHETPGRKLCFLEGNAYSIIHETPDYKLYLEKSSRFKPLSDKCYEAALKDVVKLLLCKIVTRISPQCRIRYIGITSKWTSISHYAQSLIFEYKLSMENNRSRLFDPIFKEDEFDTSIGDKFISLNNFIDLNEISS